MTRLDERLEKLGKRIKNYNQQVTPPVITNPVFSPLLPSPEDENYLPVCRNGHIPAPNVILRSSLFGVVKKGTRLYEESILKATFNGYVVKYTGKQLDQSDLDVWLECLQRCQSILLGCTVRFTAHDFLLSIGRDTGKAQHTWLKSVFIRMKATAVEISDGRYEYIGELVKDIYRDKETGLYHLALNQKITTCFSKIGWTAISKDIRMKLKGKPFILWLHGFYSSHEQPLPMKVSTLKELCGSTNSLKDFRYKLTKALKDLSYVTGWQCTINENNLVIVKK